MRHLLVTNDFPPKVGGIQSYLWELWRRLPPDDFAVLTTAHPDAPAFDRHQPFRIERVGQRLLLPSPALARWVDALAAEMGADLVILDPAVPLGLIGRRLHKPYGLVLHGAEVTVPGRLPVTRRALARVLRGAALVIAAGGYPAAEAARAAGTPLPAVAVIPPGVDVDRFRPLAPAARAAARRDFGFDDDSLLVVSVSRLVPRKGMDVLIDASARLRSSYPRLEVAIAGRGRDHRRLTRQIDASSAPARLLGAVPPDRLPDLYACADVFAMVCRSRWFGLEQEGFGIVFVEAAAAGVPQVAGDSGGAAEAVLEGETGLVVGDPHDASEVAAALDHLLGDPVLRSTLGAAARARAEAEFSYDVLAARLAAALR